MMKHKQNDDGLLTPTNYWEMKLGIKHNTEKVRYKKLCGYKLSKDEKKLLDGVYYITFSDWKEYIEGKLSVLDEKELYEYSKYINGRLQNENVFSGLFSNFMLPLIIAVLTPIFTEVLALFFDASYDDPILDFLSFLIKYGTCIIALILLIKMVVENAQENKAGNLFYKDIYEIITSKLQQNNYSWRKVYDKSEQISIVEVQRICRQRAFLLDFTRLSGLLKFRFPSAAFTQGMSRANEDKQG